MVYVVLAGSSVDAKRMENEGEVKSEEGNSESAPPAQRLCRFFSQGRHCNYGKRCRFLHVRENGPDPERKAAESPTQLDVTLSGSQNSGQLKGDNSPLTHNPKFSSASARRPCRYFLSGHCTMEDRCRFWHPPQLPTVEDPSVTAVQRKATPRRPPVSAPGGPQEVKLCDMTEDKAQQLRDTEIQQLKKRFPKDQLIIQERSDGKLTYYRVTVEATDPDWVNAVCLLFFQKYIYRSATSLKKDIDLEKAGLQFIPYQELKVSATDASDPVSGVAADEDTRDTTDKTEDAEPEEEERSVQQDERDEGQVQEEDASHLVENIKISDPRRGTEVKLLGLRLGENTATVIAQQITVCLQCNR
uniref:Nucleoporin NUP42 n=1 Tax=Fundulus heteroclitus TaxID=8078 RepID=A0A3Q2Q6I1_FUNHE